MTENKIDELFSKHETHIELSRMKVILENTIRLLFNPEQSVLYLTLVGAVTLRIGVQMVVAACKEARMSEDEAYKMIHGFIDAWWKNDREDREVEKAAKAEEVPNV